MAVLSPPPVSTDRFTYLPADGLFVIEASDLGPDFRLGRVYDDACDVGFTLVSARTGDRRVFTSVGERRDDDGDLLYEDFALVGPSGRVDQSLRVRIIND